MNILNPTLFFDVIRYPLITFQSTTLVTSNKPDTFQLKGILKIRDVAKEVALLAKFGGTAAEQGILKAGFEVLGTINRKHFGLTYNPLMEAGGMVVSEEIELIANIELIKT